MIKTRSLPSCSQWQGAASFPASLDVGRWQRGDSSGCGSYRTIPPANISAAANFPSASIRAAASFMAASFPAPNSPGTNFPAANFPAPTYSAMSFLVVKLSVEGQITSAKNTQIKIRGQIRLVIIT
jgi:hypothetical protein